MELRAGKDGVPWRCKYRLFAVNTFLSRNTKGSILPNKGKHAILPDMNKDIGKFTVMGNKARREKLSAEMRKSIASNAAKVRWAYKSHVCGFNCLCRVCGKMSFKGPHSPHSENRHDFQCQSAKSPKNI